MQENSEEFGILFQTIETDDNSILSLSLTKFDVAVVKFGQNKVLEVLEKAMTKPVNDYCNESIQSLPIYDRSSILQQESPVCVINHLVHRNVSWWVHSCIRSLEVNAPKHT